MVIAEFAKEWHGVPEGTRVEVIRSMKHMGITPVVEVERLDGKLLPHESGPRLRASVSVDLIRLTA